MVDPRREAGGGADHRGVVGAELQRHELEADALFLAELGDRGAQRTVGGDAAAERDRVPVALLQRPLQFRGQLPDHGGLEGGGEVGPPLGHALLAELAAAVDERRLQPAEAEIEAGVAGHRDRHLERGRVALLGQLLQRRPARVAEPEQPRRLVEGLAGGVIEGLAQDLVAPVVPHPRQQGVPAAGDEAEEGRLERLRLEEVGGDVALQVVDRDQRQPPRRGDRLRGADPDQEGADQARPGGDRDRLDLAQLDLGLGERRLDHRRGQFEVVARGDLGDDAAEVGVRGGLRGDQVREDPRPVEHGRAGVVAGGLDRENQAGLSRAT